jgi:hypothetical protein
LGSKEEEMKSMPITQEAIIKHIDDLIGHYETTRKISKYDDLSDLSKSIVTEMVTRLMAVIRRCAPRECIHRQGAEELISKYGVSNGHMAILLIGILKALRADYLAGYMNTVEQLIHADLFSDFLEMAEYLLNQGFKDPSAVLVGSVLEEHLRKLCLHNSIDIMNGDKPKKADSLNAELAGTTVINKLDQKSITAWLDLRNKAAHGNYNEYTQEQVQLMFEGVRNFMSRNTA